jgi:hypothetical protein
MTINGAKNLDFPSLSISKTKAHIFDETIIRIKKIYDANLVPYFL